MKRVTFDGRLCQPAMILGVLLLFAGSAQAGGKYKVINGDDSGEGSLRYGLEVEQAGKIEIDREVDTIEILTTLVYAGEKSLSIKGRGATVVTHQNVTLLALTNGADLKIDDLHFVGPGGFDINSRGDLGMDAGKGIFVDVRDDQTGTVKLDLKKVSVRGVANHGIHVSDCSLADDCGAGGGGGGEGSPASISVKLDKVVVDDAGNGKFDADGLRVDERGDGDIRFEAKKSSFTNVGADGVELDEGNAGHVVARVKGSDFSANGIYCDPKILKTFLPEPDEAEFPDFSEDPVNARLPSEIPGPVSGSPDDSCFEREVELYDSGYVEAYEFGIDVDDGFDIDEAGEGSLIVKLDRSTIDYNLDEGLDLDEEGAGSIMLDLYRSVARNNTDDGFKLTEEDDGGVYGKVRRVVSMDNGGKGLVFEEEDAGDLAVSVDRTRTANNDDSDDTGIEAVQEEPGRGKLRIRKSDIADGIDLDGVLLK